MDELDYDYLAKLVRRTQAGDSNAFAELYTATYKKQYRFTCQYVKDPYLAQDVLQEVYILVLKNITSLKNPRLFVSWLNQINFRICYDVCQKRVRYEQEYNYVNGIPETEEASDGKVSDPEKEAEERIRQAELMSQILSLHPKETQVIIMRYYNDMSLNEIADAMNCSLSTVKRCLARGKRELERRLGDRKGEILYD